MGKMMTIDDFMARLHDGVHVAVIGDWFGVSAKVKMRCLDCGHEWDVVPSSLLRGHGCPHCKRSGTSFMEQVLLYSMILAFGVDAVLFRNRGLIGKELDIYIPSRKFAIEIGSWFWHEQKYLNDLDKVKLCNAIGVRLITIYSDFNGGQVFCDADVWTYHENFSEERHVDVLKSVVERVYELLGLSSGLLFDRWQDILVRAAMSSRRMSTDEFKLKLVEIRPDIDVIGDFSGMHHSIQVSCRNCGFVWDSVPSRLLSGFGCRKCGRNVVSEKLSLSFDDYVSKLSVVNPDILVVGNYINASRPVDVKCLVCGYEWSPVASSLTSSGHGCPSCWERRRGVCLRSSHDDFMEKFLEKGNVNIEILGEYVTSKELIQVRCKLCGREWFSTPNQLLRGSGCIVCSGKQKKSNEMFVKELSLKQPSLVLLSDYVDCNSKVKVHCSVCNYEWDVRPVNLVKNHPSGCPRCGYKRAGNKNGRNTEQYVEELRIENPGIEVLEDYVNANTKILHRCIVCGCEFLKKPSWFLNYHKGCPACKGV